MGSRALRQLWCVLQWGGGLKVKGKQQGIGSGWPTRVSGRLLPYCFNWSIVLYNVVLVFQLDRRESATCVHIPPFSLDFLPI